MKFSPQQFLSSSQDYASINREPVFVALSLNAALVIIGYGLSVLSGSASVEAMRLIKNAVLLLSILNLFNQNNVVAQVAVSQQSKVFAIGGLFMVFSFFSSDFNTAISSTLTCVVPLVYVAVSVMYLLTKYAKHDVLNALLNVINWIYFIPIISFFLTGGSITNTNIYSFDTENASAFYSNHYGWAGTLFLLTGVDLLKNFDLPPWRRLFLYLFCPIAAYLTLISGNRTSWLSLGVVSIIFILQYRQLSIVNKLLLSLFPIFLVIYLAQDPTSSVNARLEKSKKQYNEGETRFNNSLIAAQYFNDRPYLWFTGVGLFNPAILKDKSLITNYHNSYNEVLFGTGILVFIFFLYLFLWQPVSKYLKYYARSYLFLPPIIIIPFFESNLTGGQFLFYPWFIFTILLGSQSIHDIFMVRHTLQAHEAELQVIKQKTK